MEPTMTIAGKSVRSADTFQVPNPATGEVVGDAPLVRRSNSTRPSEPLSTPTPVGRQTNR